MRQPTLSDNGFEKFRRKTYKDQFLDEMEVITPWKELTGGIEPFYPQPEGAGLRPIGIERMLRIHVLQHWFNLSDPAVEEALYDTRALRQFVGIDQCISYRIRSRATDEINPSLTPYFRIP